MGRASAGALRAGNVEVDPVLAGGSPDRRRGLSLIIPMDGISRSYEGLVERFAMVEAGQYFYPRGDLHCTVFDFLQARAEFERDPRLEGSFAEVARVALAGLGPFRLRLRGVAFSRSAGIMRGFDGGVLVRLRGAIRKLMVARGLDNDERYESRTSHVTFLRFRRELSEPLPFLEALGGASDLDLGDFEVTCLELVEHDWYNSEGSRRLVERFELGGASSV